MISDAGRYLFGLTNSEGVSIDCHKVCEHVYLVTSDSTRNLSEMFLRPEEFRESPISGIRGNFFTLEQYVDKYVEKYGAFDYYDEWEAFNLTSRDVCEFLKKFPEKSLSSNERLLIHTFRIILLEEGKSRWAIIGMGLNDLDVYFRHEFAHSLYFINAAYRRAVNEKIKNLPKGYFKAFRKALIDSGYSSTPDLIYDEIQAYSIEDKYARMENKECLNFKHPDMHIYCPKFKKVFDKYTCDVL